MDLTIDHLADGFPIPAATVMVGHDLTSATRSDLAWKPVTSCGMSNANSGLRNCWLPCTSKTCAMLRSGCMRMACRYSGLGHARPCLDFNHAQHLRSCLAGADRLTAEAMERLLGKPERHHSSFRLQRLP